MRYVYVRLGGVVLTGAVLAVIVALGVLLPKCEGPGPHPFTQTAHVNTVPSCTHAFGQCEVTEFIHHRLNGTVWIETCFAEPPIKPGASNVWIAVSNCIRP